LLLRPFQVAIPAILVRPDVANRLRFLVTRNPA
jgi:hypothetical protein